MLINCVKDNLDYRGLLDGFNMPVVNLKSINRYGEGQGREETSSSPEALLRWCPPKFRTVKESAGLPPARQLFGGRASLKE